jgi:hypothetical protein
MASIWQINEEKAKEDQRKSVASAFRLTQGFKPSHFLKRRFLCEIFGNGLPYTYGGPAPDFGHALSL